VNRIKRLSHEVLDQHKSKFGVDFDDNKKFLDEVAIIRSKGLRNEIAGFITRFLKREIRDQQSKEARIEADEQIVNEAEATSNESVAEPTQTQSVSETPPSEQPE